MYSYRHIFPYGILKDVTIINVSIDFVFPYLAGSLSNIGSDSQCSIAIREVGKDE